MVFDRPKGKIFLWTYRCRGEDNIKTDLGDMNCIDLAQIGCSGGLLIHKLSVSQM
jgi:hypothetical protein